jgi:hypothetical protein
VFLMSLFSSKVSTTVQLSEYVRTFQERLWQCIYTHISNVSESLSVIFIISSSLLSFIG